MKFLKAFGQFWYDFIIGDDWKIAVAVVLALGVTLVVMATGVLGDAALTALGGVAIFVAFAISLAIDVRPKR
ncbi:hypothetical protein ACIBL3_33460 [Kribbella sp. NPDC050124]|uniref:hypothetical protein n=1 Tax=Kribbella sp. NPDC050124 TaxID=3364114 RepID=UPI0037B5FE67